MKIIGDLILCCGDFIRIVLFYWFLTGRKKIKWNIEAILLILLGILLDYTLTVGISIPYIYAEIFFILITCFIGVVLYKISIYASFIYALLYTMIGHLVSLIETSVYGSLLDISFMHMSQTQQFMISVGYQFVCVFACFVCARHFKGLGNEKDVHLLQQLVFLLTPTTVLYTEIFYFSFLDPHNEVYTILAFLASLSCLTIIYIGKEICLQKEKELRNALLVQKLDSTKTYAEDIAVYYEKAREIRHDMKSYWQMMDVLLKEGKYQEAKKIVAMQGKALQVDKVIPYSGNTYLDAILYQNVINHPEIDFRIQIQDMCHIYMETMDFCSLIINLINNAVEGASGDNKYVSIRVEQDRYKLSICVSNPITRTKTLETEKDDKEQHGLGLNIIYKIVDTYDGEVFIQQKNGIFTTKVMISNQEVA